MPVRVQRFPTLWIFGLGMSCATLAWGSAMEFAMPTPETTGNWSFYGILICAIIVLGVCIGFILRWIATTWLKEMQANKEVLISLRDILERHTEALNKNTMWFEKITQSFVQHGLEATQMSIYSRKGHSYDS